MWGFPGVHCLSSCGTYICFPGSIAPPPRTQVMAQAGKSLYANIL
jgi:hypothetical protein